MDAVKVGYVQDATNLNGVTDVKVSGNYAFVLSELNTSLCVVDITDKTTPVVIASLQDATKFAGAGSLFVSGNYVYIACVTNDYLTIVDVSVKTAPTIVGSLQDTTDLNGARAVFVAGNYAFVTALNATKLAIVDITDKTSPSLVSATGTTAAPYEVIVEGELAYLTLYRGFSIFDVTNKAAPTQLSITTYSTGTYLEGLYKDGDYLFFNALNSANNLACYDVSTPAYPIAVNTALNPGSAAIQSVGESADFIFTNTPTKFIKLNYSITTKEKEKVTPRQFNATYDRINFFRVSGNYAYVNFYDAAFNYTLVIYNVSNKENITKVGEVSFFATTDFKIEGNYLYAACGRYFKIVDISNKAAPSVVGSYDAGVSYYIYYIDKESGVDYVYGAGAFGASPRLYKINVSNKTSPSLTKIASGGNQGQIAVDGTYVYASQSGGGSLALYEKTNLTVSYSKAATIGASVIKSGNYVYTSTPLVIFDVSTPASIAIVSTGSGVAATAPISINGNYLYSCLANKIDVSTPASPVEAGAFSYPSINNIEGDGSNIFFSAVNNGFFILDETFINASTIPLVIQTLTDADFANLKNFIISGNYAYLTEYDGDKLIIVQVNDAAAASSFIPKVMVI